MWKILAYKMLCGICLEIIHLLYYANYKYIGKILQLRAIKATHCAHFRNYFKYKYLWLYKSQSQLCYWRALLIFFMIQIPKKCLFVIHISHVTSVQVFNIFWRQRYKSWSSLLYNFLGTLLSQNCYQQSCKPIITTLFLLTCIFHIL